MENEIKQRLLELLKFLQSHSGSSATKVMALSDEFNLESSLECFGSIDKKHNVIMDKRHYKPIHITGVVKCAETHILVGDVASLACDNEYFENFVSQALKHKLLNIIPI